MESASRVDAVDKLFSGSSKATVIRTDPLTEGRNDMVKLVRYGPRNAEKPGVIDGDGQIRDLSDHVVDFSGDVLSPEGFFELAKIDSTSLSIVRGHPRIAAVPHRYR